MFLALLITVDACRKDSSFFFILNLGGTSKKEEVKRLPGGKVKKKVSIIV